MGNHFLPSVSTRTQDFAPKELELRVETAVEESPVQDVYAGAGERIRDALRRWFEEAL